MGVGAVAEAMLFFLLGLTIGAGLCSVVFSQPKIYKGLGLLPAVMPTQPPAPPTPVEDGKAEALEQKIAALENRLQEAQALLYQAPIGYIQVDEENQLLWSNAQACKTLGLARPMGEIIPPRLLLELVRSYELDQLIDQTRQTKVSHQKDWVLNLVTPDPINPNEGTAYALRGYGLPLPQGQVGVFLENRQEAIMLMQQRDRWTSDVAHELKTPLTSIRLVTETLRSRVDESLQGWLDRLLNEILRLSNLVEDLLNLSRLETRGGTGLSLKPVDLPQLIFAAWQGLEPLAQIKKLELVYEGPTELVVILDEALMHRVFINLMDNAIKFSPAQETILVKVAIQKAETWEEDAPDFQVQVDVVDHGTGFKPLDLPYIFSRFYRADPARSRSPLPQGTAIAPIRPVTNSGTGLGLSIVQQIMEAHHGRVEARNHPETGGGWLSLLFPLHIPESDPPK